MGKIPAKGIDPFVTIEAGSAVGGDMSRCETGILLIVTGRARGNVESGHIIAVTIRAHERIVLRLELVRVEKIS